MTKVMLKGLTWDHVRGYDPMVSTAEVFNERYPDIEIVWHKRSLQAFADRPLSEMVKEYDLMVIDHPHAGEAASESLLLHLDGQGYDDELRRLADESVGLSHHSYHDGRQWALAIDAATPIAAYRSDLLSKPPENWSEVISLAEQGQVVWPLKPIDALMSFYNVLANAGHPFGSVTGGVTEDAGIWALGEMRKVSDHLDDRCFGMNPIAAYEWLANRNDRSYVPYLYGYSNYSRPGFRPYRVDGCNAPVHGNGSIGGTTLGGTGIAISSYSRHKQEALKYAFWIAGSSAQSSVFFQSGGQPGNLKAWLDPDCNRATNHFFTNTLETLENAYLRPRHKGYLVFQDEGGDLVNRHLRERNDARETVQAIREAYTRSLNER